METREVLMALWQNPDPWRSPAVTWVWALWGRCGPRPHRACAGLGFLAAHSVWEDRQAWLPCLVQGDPQWMLHTSPVYRQDGAEIWGNPVNGVGWQGSHTYQGPPFSFPASSHPLIPEVTNHHMVL